MAKTLPKTPFQLHGGCFCSAIRYTISVPTLSERRALPQSPANLDRMLVPVNEVNERMPIIFFDHCASCRRVPGSIVESWIICPPEWVSFTLQPRTSASASPDDKDIIKLEAMEYLQTDESLPERTHLTHFKSSEHSNRTFCGKCGTHISFLKTGPMTPLRSAMGSFFDVAVGTLDKESLEMEGFAPSMQAWDKDGISWVVKLINEGKKALLADVADDLSKLKVEDSETK
jgi:hypothetical protein